MTATQNRASQMSSKHFDAIVIGSGASGSFAARELTAQGLEVLLVEAGREVKPEEFDPARRPKNPRQINIFERALATLTGQAVQARAVFFKGMLSNLYVNDRDNPYFTPKDAPFVWIRGRQAGGRTHTFGRVLLRWTDHDFKSKSLTGRGVDWPISYTDIEPYYDEVESALGLYGNNDGVSTLPDGKYIGSAKLSPSEKQFKEAVESRWPERHVIAFRSIAPEPSRIFRPLREAMASGRLTIRYHSVVRRILTEGKRATGVEIVDTASGEIATASAAHVVVCGSPIESVRLLLNSKSPAHPDGLGNSSGQLGRYFMDQLPMLAMGRMPQPAEAWTGDDSQPPDPFYGPGGGIFIPRSEKFTGGDFGIQGVFGRETAAPGEPLGVMAMGFGQMQPDADNRITLHPSKTDRWGIPAPYIRCKIGSDDEKTLEREEEAFIEMVKEVGGEVEFMGSPRGMREWGRGVYPKTGTLSRFLFRRLFKRVMVMGAAIHESGGARMGEDPQHSVLNQWGQCWDAPNVYVTDASAFAGSGVSGTTLTIMALTVRACRHLAGGARG